MKKAPLVTIVLVAIFALSSCATTAENLQEQDASQPEATVDQNAQTTIIERLVSLEDFNVPLTPATDPPSFLNSGFGLLPPEGCESGQNELFNSLNSESVSFFIPTNFEDESRNNDTILTQELFEFSSPEEAKLFVDVVQKSVADGCNFDGSFSDLVFYLTKLSSPDFTVPGISYYREQSQNPSATCGAEIFVSRNQYWIQISGSFVFITQASAIECGYEADTAPWEEVLRLGEIAASKVS